MPIYEYLCPKCGHQSEQMCRVEERDAPCKRPCVDCGARGVRRDWRSAPVGGVDATAGPGADFKELAKKIARGVPKSARENLERAASLRGRKYGPQ